MGPTSLDYLQPHPVVGSLFLLRAPPALRERYIAMIGGDRTFYTQGSEWTYLRAPLKTGKSSTFESGFRRMMLQTSPVTASSHGSHNTSLICHLRIISDKRGMLSVFNGTNQSRPNLDGATCATTRLVITWLSFATAPPLLDPQPKQALYEPCFTLSLSLK